MIQSSLKTNTNLLVYSFIAFVILVLLHQGLHSAALVAFIPLIIYLSYQKLRFFWSSFLIIYSFSWLYIILGFLPKQFTWFPEISSLIFLLYILLNIKEIKAKKEIFIFLIIILFSVLSFLINFDHINIYIYLAGLRLYLKFIPFFFFPFLLKTEEYHRFKTALPKFILTVAFIQVPVAFYQRFFLYKSTISGDPIGGTLGPSASGHLTQFLFMVIVYYIALSSNNQISNKKGALSISVLLLPCLLNETKITYLLLAGILIYYVLLQRKTKISTRLYIIVLSLIFVWFLTEVYYAFFRSQGLKLLFEIFLHPVDYVYDHWYTKDQGLDRIPQIIFAFQNISKDIYSLLFGVGIGNASDSFFGSAVGNYYLNFLILKIDGIHLARYLWEWGIIGTSLWIYFIVRVCRYSNLITDSILSKWYKGVLIVVIIGAFYNSNIISNVLGYLFWSISGLVCREYYEQKKW
ncbi:MAG: hypothetical protein GF353_24180 [Candidatus Lokiarchaeota archaeon]|nr:hypothetical protein [Candidatus Lokiarchaeota archaeon]